MDTKAMMLPLSLMPDDGDRCLLQVVPVEPAHGEAHFLPLSKPFGRDRFQLIQKFVRKRRIKHFKYISVFGKAVDDIPERPVSGAFHVEIFEIHYRFFALLEKIKSVVMIQGKILLIDFVEDGPVTVYVDEPLKFLDPFRKQGPFPNGIP